MIDEDHDVAAEELDIPDQEVKDTGVSKTEQQVTSTLGRFPYDTITLAYDVAIDRDELNVTKWDYFRTPHNNGFVTHIYTANVMTRLGTNVFLRYIPSCYHGKPSFQFTASIPKLDHGDNCSAVKDLTTAIRAVTYALMSLHVPMDKIVVEKGRIVRLDPFADFYTPHYLYDHLNILKVSDYPKRGAESYSNNKVTDDVKRRHDYSYADINGVAFRIEEEELDFYDKGKESKKPAMTGVMRMENSLTKRPLGAFFGDIPLTFSNLDKVTPKVAPFLGKKLGILGVAHPLARVGDFGLMSLAETMGMKEARKVHSIFEILAAYPDLKTKALAEVMECDPQTIRNKKAVLREHGITPARIKHRSVPGLAIRDQ